MNCELEICTEEEGESPAGINSTIHPKGKSLLIVSHLEILLTFALFQIFALFLLRSGFSSCLFTPCNGLAQLLWGQEGYIKSLRHWLWFRVVDSSSLLQGRSISVFPPYFLLVKCPGTFVFLLVLLSFLVNKTTTLPAQISASWAILQPIVFVTHLECHTATLKSLIYVELLPESATMWR